MSGLLFNTPSKFVNCGFLSRFSHSEILSADVRSCASNSVDSFLRPAIASKLLRICLSGFRLANAEAGNGLTCRVYKEQYSTHPREFKKPNTQTIRLRGDRR